MKKMLLILFILITNSFLFSQTLVLEENFDYSAGTNLTSNGWAAFSATGVVPILISSSGLSYSGYVSSNIGNSVIVTGGSGSREDDSKSFTSQNSESLYVSFLISITSVGTAGDYFMHLNTGTPVGRVFVKKDASSSSIAFGISKNSTSPNFTSFSYSSATTYLLVLKYTFNTSNTTDDVVSLFINPSLSGAEPSADLQAPAGETDATASTISSVALRQGSNAYNVTIDGIRIATAWSEAPLPVELTSFTSNVNGNKVELNWKTATEVNNYGFEVERSEKLEARGEKWTKIGFVEGNGNSNSPKSYSFTDEPTGGKEFNYRLKQIDFDGAYEYSEIITAALENVSTFALEQNFPNPFNPTTKISYTIPQRVNVKLKIYDMIAQQVAELVNTSQEAGHYQVTFDGSDLPSGVYFYKLEAGKFVEVKKFMLLK